VNPERLVSVRESNTIEIICLVLKFYGLLSNETVMCKK
jgi:hypothetical protein